MNLTPYITSGVLELYVLDQLSAEERMGVERMVKMYPVLKKELLAIENALEKYATNNALKPSKKFEAKVVAVVNNLEKERTLDIENLPIINPFSNYKNWLPLAQAYLNITLTDGIFNKVLQQSDKVTQVLVVSEIDIPEEIHEGEHESFLILDGRCECIINGNSHLMGPGDFMAIPLLEPHDVKLKSKRVTAILQHLTV